MTHVVDDAVVRRLEEDRARWTLPPELPDAAEKRLWRAVTPRALMRAAADIRPTQMPSVLNAELVARWPGLVAAGNPYATYGNHSLVNWPDQPSVTLCLLAYMQTGDAAQLERAKTLYLPDVTQGQAIPHLHEIGYAVDYLLVQPYLSAEQDAEWQRRLKALADKMAAYAIGDLDQCLTYQCYFKILERHLGTSYFKFDIAEYLSDYFAPGNYEGGPFDASSFYEQSTAQLLCWAAAAYGKDIFPWFDDWARQYVEFSRWALSRDGKAAAWWGDQQGDDPARVWAYHRVHLYYLLAGLGYDPQGDLRSLAWRLLTNKPVKDYAHSVYPAGRFGMQFVCDPALMMDDPGRTMPDGGYVASGIGFTVWRNGDNYVQAYLPRKVFDDHHYDNYFGAAQQYNGKHVNPMPGGYYPVNRAFNANAIRFKHLDWFWTAQFDEAQITDDGFVAKGSAIGPWPKWMADDSGRLIPPGPDDFAFCRFETEIRYSQSRDELTYIDTFSFPGGTFPAPWLHWPTWTRFQHAVEEIVPDGDGWVWGDRRLKVLLLDAARQVFPVTGTIEARGALNPNAPDVSWWRLTLSSPADLPSGEYVLTTAIRPRVPQPEPPPIEPPAELESRVERLERIMEAIKGAIA